MDFNEDDPLGDLLSDGSDDSFFATKPKRKDEKNSATGTPAASKSKMENLFGIKDAVSTKPAPPVPIPVARKPETSTRPRTSASVENKPAAPAARQPTPKKDISFDDDDIFADLGFDPKKPKSVVKKSNILDDLLGLNDTNKAAKPATKVTPTPSNRPTTAISRQSTTEKPDEPAAETISTGYAPTNRSTVTPLTKRKSETRISDPLGFFSATTAAAEPMTAKSETPKAAIKKHSSTADWLGIGDGDSGRVNSAATLIATKEIEPIQSVTLPPPPPPQVPQPLPNIAHAAQLMTNTGNESSLHALQQHESQLLVAIQMKNQELALVDMQRKQQELLAQQEHHFNELLQKQMQRQAGLEQQIQWQQERINSHITLLMAPASSSVPFSAAAPTANDGETIVATEVKQFELEKLRWDSVLHSVQTNHDQEVELLDQSHRKQIRLLEENLEHTEQRLRDETSHLEQFYTSKIKALTDERDRLIAVYEQKIAQLEENYAKIVAKLKVHHTEEVNELRTDHRSMIDHLRQSKLMEFALVQDSASYLDALKSASSYLETASGDLQTVRLELEAKLERTHREREVQLEVREQRMLDQQKHVDKLRESTETERVALLELVKSLETKLNSVTLSAEEDSWSLRQQRATLDTERAAFEREREFARERFAREEKRMEDLKAYHQTENQRLQQQIQDDRLAVLTEKSKLETMERVNRRPGGEMTSMSRTEVDAAVQVAQDAARQADTERERLIEQQRKFESRRRELIDEETAIRARESDLEAAINEAKSKERVTEARVRACTVTEQQLTARHNHLQTQSQELTSRETQLAHEKFELSRERLQLQAERRKLYYGRCSLCKIGDQSKELAELLSRANVTGGMTIPTEHNSWTGKGVDGGRDVVDAVLDHEVTGAGTPTWYPGNVQPLTNLFEANDMEADLLLARFEAMNKGFSQ